MWSIKLSDKAVQNLNFYTYDLRGSASKSSSRKIRKVRSKIVLTTKMMSQNMIRVTVCVNCFKIVALNFSNQQLIVDSQLIVFEFIFYPCSGLVNLKVNWNLEPLSYLPNWHSYHISRDSRKSKIISFFLYGFLYKTYRDIQRYT